VFDLLRLYQLTGEAAWLAAARRRALAAARALPPGSPDLAVPLQLVELEAPCRAVRAPFDWA
jgi:hypothetical protein